LPDVERICDHALIMHNGRVRFFGGIDELRGVRGRDFALAVEVKADAAGLAAALAEAGAACEVISAVGLHVNLPESATSGLVFERARAVGVQIRALAPRRETLEAAFLRVIGEAAPASAAPASAAPASAVKEAS
jgi:ABC-type multidrug transport system ATPase subunit